MSADAEVVVDGVGIFRELPYCPMLSNCRSVTDCTEHRAVDECVPRFIDLNDCEMILSLRTIASRSKPPTEGRALLSSCLRQAFDAQTTDLRIDGTRPQRQ